MRPRTKNDRKHSQTGVALVMAIFTVMLISVVATALILMAGTQAAVKGNYKSSMHAFYDAKAGLEEARARLWLYNPNTINSCVFPAGGAPMPIDRVCYIVNPSPNEVVNPTDLSPANPYADFEYRQEFKQDVTAAAGLQPFVPSTSPIVAAGIAGPLYKWVRITPRTAYSGNIDVDGSGNNGTNPLDSTTPLFYDGSQSSVAASGFSQVLTITALSLTPYGSRRMVQYTVAQTPPASLYSAFAPGAFSPPTFSQVMPAPITMLGSSPTFLPAHRFSFQVNGNDRSGPNAGSCSTAPQSAATALGIAGDPDSIIAAIQALHRQSSYQVSGVPSPSVSDISGLIPAGEFDPSMLDSGQNSLVQSITNLASEVVTGPSTGLPNYGSPSSPVVAAVLPSAAGRADGNLTLNNVNGYGILLVTGQLTLSGNVGWRGIILVIGQGRVDGNAARSEIDGSMVVATTRDSSGAPLSTLGNPRVDWTNGHGPGFFYDSCWMNAAMSAFPYKVLSFREVPQLQ
jgi:hypothetical protein